MNFSANLLAGWTGFLAGAVTGALMGMFFHRENWLGGYGSFPRRMIRLGHIACFGLGLIKILFALTAATLAPFPIARAVSTLLVIDMITMPLNCFLTAWKKSFRQHEVKKLWAAAFIEFADDNTFADRRHGHALCDAMAGEHVRWFTETDISVAQDDLLLRKMRRAGCAQVLIGLEDPAEGTNGMELKSNWKARQRAHYLDSIRRILTCANLR